MVRARRAKANSVVADKFCKTAQYFVPADRYYNFYILPHNTKASCEKAYRPEAFEVKSNKSSRRQPTFCGEAVGA